MAEETTREIQKEMTFLPFLAKLNERIRIFLECVKDRRDNVLETDWEILHAIHPLWFNGDITFYQTVQIPITTKATEQTLFKDDKVAENLDGKVIVNSEVNQNE